MPNRHIGYRSPRGEWRWEEVTSEAPWYRSRAGRRALLFAVALVAALAAIAGLILSIGSNGASSPTEPTATPQPPYFGVWNDAGERWDTKTIHNTGTDEYLLMVVLPASPQAPTPVQMLFRCDDRGSVELIEPSPELVERATATPPGPGRSRPDAAALRGTMALWEATLQDPPEWARRQDCAEGQELRFKSTAAEGSVYVMVSIATPDAGSKVTITVRAGQLPPASLTIGR